MVNGSWLAKRPKLADHACSGERSVVQRKRALLMLDAAHYCVRCQGPHQDMFHACQQRVLARLIGVILGGDLKH
eukprot:954373-Pelagomonas_calceolata.AAC.3